MATIFADNFSFFVDVAVFAATKTLLFLLLFFVFFEVALVPGFFELLTFAAVFEVLLLVFKFTVVFEVLILFVKPEQKIQARKG